jgi:hypothetical protein
MQPENRATNTEFIIKLMGRVLDLGWKKHLTSGAVEWGV